MLISTKLKFTNLQTLLWQYIIWYLNAPYSCYFSNTITAYDVKPKENSCVCWSCTKRKRKLLLTTTQAAGQAKFVARKLKVSLEY